MLVGESANVVKHAQAVQSKRTSVREQLNTAIPLATSVSVHLIDSAAARNPHRVFLPLSLYYLPWE